MLPAMDQDTTAPIDGGYGFLRTRRICDSRNITQINMTSPEALKKFLAARWSGLGNTNTEESFTLTFDSSVALEKLMRADKSKGPTLLRDTMFAIATLEHWGWQEGHVTMLSADGTIYLSAKMTLLGVTLQRHFAILSNEMNVDVMPGLEGPFQKLMLAIHDHQFDVRTGFGIIAFEELGEWGLLGVRPENDPDESSQKSTLHLLDGTRHDAQPSSNQSGGLKFLELPREIRDGIYDEILSNFHYVVDTRDTAPPHVRAKLVACVNTALCPCKLLAASPKILNEFCEAERRLRRKRFPTFLVEPMSLAEMLEEEGEIEEEEVEEEEADEEDVDDEWVDEEPFALSLDGFSLSGEVRVAVICENLCIDAGSVCDDLAVVLEYLSKACPTVKAIKVQYLYIRGTADDATELEDWRNYLGDEIDGDPDISVEFLPFETALIPIDGEQRSYGLVAGLGESVSDRLIDREDLCAQLDFFEGGRLSPEVSQCLRSSLMSRPRGPGEFSSIWSVKEGELVNKLFPRQPTTILDPDQLGSCECWKRRVE